MTVSVFDLFKIGIGPSSSHTVGPMRAAGCFMSELTNEHLLPRVRRIRTELYGSLGATGKGHGSDRGVLLGLLGESPESVDVDLIEDKVRRVSSEKALVLPDGRALAFSIKDDIAFFRTALPQHPNGLRFVALEQDGTVVKSSTYLSVGGGFVQKVDEKGVTRCIASPALPFPFTSGQALLKVCRDESLSIAQVVLANERVYRTEVEIVDGLMRIWQVMQDCVSRGCRAEGALDGPLSVRRRAKELHDKLMSRNASRESHWQASMDWLDLFALAVNEENAGGGRVVTAPTNGAAGIIPAVMHYYRKFVPEATDRGIVEFLLTSAAIGALYKTNGSISGAEVGCQGEVGVACSMAAAGLCAVMGGTPEQVENAAEIGMEHNLGLTCDPVGGRVQIPCIERNAMGAVKAVNAARMALHGNGAHYVSLDSVIRTMMQTGADMKTKYKETSRGGLAVNVTEC